MVNVANVINVKRVVGGSGDALFFGQNYGFRDRAYASKMAMKIAFIIPFHSVIPTQEESDPGAKRMPHFSRGRIPTMSE